MKIIWMSLLCLIMSISVAVADCCQDSTCDQKMQENELGSIKINLGDFSWNGDNSTYTKLISEKEVESRLSSLRNSSLKGNATVCLLISIPTTQSTPPVPEVETNIAQIGFGPCACDTSYAGNKFRANNCCNDNRCHKDCRDNCESEWSFDFGMWKTNICHSHHFR